jgi:hypothetical protein
MRVVQTILGVKGSYLKIENCDIRAVTRNMKDMVCASAIYNNNGSVLSVKNSTLHADAPFDDAATPCSDGLQNYGIAILENTNATGTINGVTQAASLL